MATGSRDIAKFFAKMATGSRDLAKFTRKWQQVQGKPHWGFAEPFPVTKMFAGHPKRGCAERPRVPKQKKFKMTARLESEIGWRSVGRLNDPPSCRQGNL